ncbi:hypothetical protein KJ652_04370 [Patescibacteria group bacterium]|nr:hypothetical protein [Patescibacteria group bacterium]MBU1123802.1 hypothetical protein [Patescibacteria group bacterium]
MHALTLGRPNPIAFVTISIIVITSIVFANRDRQLERSLSAQISSGNNIVKVNNVSELSPGLLQKVFSSLQSPVHNVNTQVTNRLSPSIVGRASVGDSGPAAAVIIISLAAAGVGLARKKRKEIKL